jgi:hypothetical protein
MKWRNRFLTLSILVAVVGALSIYFFRDDDSAKRAAESTRQQLREQGFKVDLSEFNFFTPAEVRARERFLTNAIGPMQDKLLSEYQPYMKRLHVFPRFLPDLMEILGRDVASVVALQELRYPTGEDYWMDLRHQLSGEESVRLDAACDVLISNPLRFHLDASRGVGMLLPHLASMRKLQQTLGARVVLLLHDTNRAAAWTNLLASTRLVTAWDPEPTEVSQTARYSCAQAAFNILWQALQTGGWSEEQLSQLEQEWAAADFLKALPETAAFSRASWVALCRLERDQPLPANTTSVAQMIRSPSSGFYEIQARVQRERYRNYGTYEDERELLLHYRDREMQLRRTARTSTWLEMGELPNAGNARPYLSKYPSNLQMVMNASELGRTAMSHGVTICAQAAATEARRRVILTALALERFKLKHGAYPKTLEQLAAGEIKSAGTNALVDFMDGKPLRYRTTSDGRFVLYSIGLDCADDGGMAENETPLAQMRKPGILGKDIVWPRPATAAEIQVEEDRKQAEMDRLKARQSAFGGAALR